LIQIIPELSVAPDEKRSPEEKNRLAPIIRLANLIMTKAIKMRASDIHLEPSQREFRVRYRIDGILKEDMHLPKWVQGALVSRIKILAKLDIASAAVPWMERSGSSRMIARLISGSRWFPTVR
jgi:type II secretory ATPase GspE/PulE/Tfp pilus assembly ATPase PilB-like protein